MTRRGVAVLAVTAVAASAPEAAFERRIEAATAGRVAVLLDRHVYEHARLDLGDLRLIDRGGEEVPYLLLRAPVPAPVRSWQPAIVNRSFQPGISSRATLDNGSRALKDQVDLSLSGDSFRRRVVVEGSDDAEEWRTLVDSAWVFAVPEPQAARHETVRFPGNDQRYLRITVLNGPDDPSRVLIRSARVRRAAPSPPERLIAPRASVFQDSERRETHAVIDLGARYQPFHAVVLDVSDPLFFRKVTVEARREPFPELAAPGAARLSRLLWVELSRGVIQRHEGRDSSDPARVDVVGRARVLRLRIADGDDRPLAVSRVRAAVPLERLVFAAVPGERYRLHYGDPKRAAPSYDLGATVRDPEAWAASAVDAGLLAPVQLSRRERAPEPWSERHPALLWAGLLATVAGLGALTWRALRLDP